MIRTSTAVRARDPCVEESTQVNMSCPLSKDLNTLVIPSTEDVPKSILDTPPPHIPHTKEEFEIRVQECMNDLENFFSLENQALGEILNDVKVYIAKIKLIQHISVPDNFMYHLEGLITLYFAATRCTDTVQGVAIAALYTQRFYTKSITKIVTDTLIELSIRNQAWPDSGGRDWIDLLRDAKDNWRLIVNNEGFSHLSKVISLMIGLGLCDAQKVNFTIAGMKIFSTVAVSKHSSAFDLVDAVFETVIFFVEGGYECFLQGSLSPLITGEFEYQDLDKRIVACEANADYARNGNLEKLANITPEEFDVEIRAVIAKIEVVCRTTKNSFIKKILYEKKKKLQILLADYLQTRVEGGLREAPYAMAFFGGSGVGKSCVSNILMVTTLHYNGFKCSDEYIATIQPTDKYMPTAKSNINGYKLDDVGNTKAQFVERAPTALIIDIINNVRCYANKADVAEKGKVSLDPKVVTITSNIKTMCAEEYSKEPCSITRRAQYIATVKVRDEFTTNGMLDAGKLSDFYGGQVPIIPDAWEITVERSFPVPNPTPGKPALIAFKILHYDDPHFGPTPLENVSLDTLISYSNRASKVFYAQQKDFVEKSNNLDTKLDFCGECREPSSICRCGLTSLASTGSDTSTNSESTTSSDEESSKNEEVMETQAGVIFYNRVLKFTTQHFAPKFVSDRMDYLEERVSDVMITTLESMMVSRYSKWTNWLPTWFLDNRALQQYILDSNDRTIRSKLRSLYIFGTFFFFAFLLVGYFFHPVYWLLSLLSAHTMSVSYETEKARLLAAIVEDNQSMPSVFKKYRDDYIAYATGASAMIGVTYLIVQAWKFARSTSIQNQGNLAPSSIEEIAKRDREAAIQSTIAQEHNWETVQVEPLPCSKQSSTITVDQLSKLILGNMAVGQFYDERGDKVSESCVLFIKSNIAVIPYHVASLDSVRVDLYFRDKNTKGTNFTARISKEHMYRIPNQDQMMVYISNGGDRVNLVKYFPPVRVPRKCPAKLVGKMLGEGEVKVLPISSKLWYKPCPQVNQLCAYEGGSYKLEFMTFSGLCQSAIITDTTQRVIAGLHVAGFPNSPQGSSAALVQSELQAGLDFLESKSSILLPMDSGTLDDTIFDKKYIENQSIHFKSPINDLPSDAHVRVYGSCTGRAKYFSKVSDTILVEPMKEILGIENKFGKPKFHLGKSFKTTLDFISTPSLGMPGELLDRSVDDYVEPIIEKIKSIPGLVDTVKPLTRMETICGCDGVRFIDAMKSNTAIGPPLTGAKSNFMEDLEPDDYPDQACPKAIDKQFWDHFESTCHKYLCGERGYLLFKACLKDEPTPLEKEKVRVFEAASMTLQLIVRMYFLPIVRLLSIFPLLSECAVGINTVGPEYSVFIEAIRKYGIDRIVAGDYKKYDLRMPAQLTLAAFKVLILIAKALGYTSDALTIMRGAATDICFPLIMYNGDLIQVFGSNPSGQNLTVYINSIVNSLQMRCAFYSRYDFSVPFRSAVSLGTYGDDYKGSVAKGYDDFDNIHITDFMGEHGQTVTAPDKTDEIVKFLKDEDADFLKRKNVFNPYLEVYHGALDEDSITKSLLNKTNPKIGDKELAGQVLDGACREYWFHGEEKFTAMQQDLFKVAKVAEVDHLCVMFNKTYGEVTVDYCKRYDIPIPDVFRHLDIDDIPPLEWLPLDNLSREDTKLVPPSVGTMLEKPNDPESI